MKNTTMNQVTKAPFSWKSGKIKLFFLGKVEEIRYFCIGKVEKVCKKGR
ncbi:MAG: hypothetical protein J6K05_08735 [Bacteroidaceae bacterium]|nr:hypothetical protein [Bacteroidaceae bacterium]